VGEEGCLHQDGHGLPGLGETLIIATGTKNPAKVEGIKRGVAKYFPKFEVRPVDSSTVAKAQPRGLAEMTAGATARAKFALSKAGGDFGVGVEAGIFTIGEVYFDNQVAAVADPSGRVSLGHSAGFSLPKDDMEKLFREGKELERWAEKVSGVQEIGDKGGLIDFLTGGKMTRADLTEQCVLTAFIPWMHKGIYGL
jgi:inosine/xanthosine triphosphatase